MGNSETNMTCTLITSTADGILNHLQSTLVISNSLSRSENLVPAETRTSNNRQKILWKRGEIAPEERFLLFSTIFSIYLHLQESNYMFICEMWLFYLFFPQSCKSDMSRYGYLVVIKSPLDFEITSRLYFRENKPDISRECHVVYSLKNNKKR